MSEHKFSGIVYDFNCHILFANLYVYGFKKDKLPDDYVPVQPIDKNFDPNERIELAGKWNQIDDTSGASKLEAVFLLEVFIYVLWKCMAMVNIGLKYMQI